MQFGERLKQQAEGENKGTGLTREQGGTGAVSLVHKGSGTGPEQRGGRMCQRHQLFSMVTQADSEELPKYLSTLAECSTKWHMRL